MSKDPDIPKKQLDLLKSAFGSSQAEKKPSKPKKKEKKPKEKCPYCGEMYKSVAHHLSHCKQNPENIEQPSPEPQVYERHYQRTPPSSRTTRRVYVEEITQQADWSELIVEGVKTLRNLTDYLKSIKDEGIKIQLLK